jgi:hypothetical protein
MSVILLEDRLSNGRGFFSSINLLLFSLLWCEDNGLKPVVGQSILKAYSHSVYSLFGRRPFTQFFGESYTRDNLPNMPSRIDIGDIFEVRDWYSSEDLYLRLHIIASRLVNDLSPPAVYDYIYNVHADMSGRYPGRKRINVYDSNTVSIHYRGCDYLANVPVGHNQNISPSEMAAKVISLLPSDCKIFVATDDKSFLNILSSAGLQFSCFDAVQRGGPGRGIHHKRRLQSLGFEKLHKPFMRGLEVLRDCIFLSQSKYYFGTNSNIMFFARLLNPELCIVNLNQN